MRKVGHPDMKLNKYVGGSIAALAAAAIAVGSVLPAQADPTRPYAAAGSDTIQDVWNALTNDGAASPFATSRRTTPSTVRALRPTRS